MDQTFSRPIRISGNGNVTGQKVLDRATRVSVISVKPGGQDVIVTFKDGIAGQSLWTVEADASSGSHMDSFPHPLLFPNGIYMDVDSDQSAPNWVVNVAVLEPKSSGT